jgi:hypothetical protein
VRVEGVDRERAYFVGENPAISIRVDRSDAGATPSPSSARSRRSPPSCRQPARGRQIDLIRTRAEAITDRLNILLDNGLMGLALVVGLLFLFLNARTAFWVAAGIPVAMLAAIALMYAGGADHQHDLAVRADHHAGHRGGRRHRGGRTRRFPRPPARRSPRRGAENAARRMACRSLPPR